MMYVNGQSVAPTFTVAERHEYSTSEQVVGTWIDGKPIYERTIYYDQTIAGSGDKKTVLATIPNIYLLNAWGVLTEYTSDQNMHQIKQIPYAQVGYGQSQAIVYNVENEQIELQSRYNYTKVQLYDVYITIQYTKTTD